MHTKRECSNEAGLMISSELKITPEAIQRICNAKQKLESEDHHQTSDSIMRRAVFQHYGPIFSIENIELLSREDYLSFLRYKNNHHWSGLARNGSAAVSDMKSLRKALRMLLDEQCPIAVRFPTALNMVSGFGKATATAILTVAYPERYGVWNQISERGLKTLNLWPSFESGEGLGIRYERANHVLAALCKGADTSFWVLDRLWWRI